MPSNSVEECAVKLASCKQGATESVSDYSLRFRTLTNRFELALECQTQGRLPWAAFSVNLFQHGLIPSIQCLQLSDKPVASLREAVDRARRHEAASLVGGTVSAVSFTHVSNRAATTQFRQAASQPAQRGRSRGSMSGRGGRGGRGGGGRGGGSASGGSSSGGSQATRPSCTYVGCKKPIGHTVERCFQKQRKDRERGEAQEGNRSRKDRTNDDEEEDDE